MEKVTVGMDLCFEGGPDFTTYSLHKEIFSFLEKATKLDIEFKVIAGSGPGGGNPYCHLTGTLENLQKLMPWCTAKNGCDDLDFFIIDESTRKLELTQNTFQNWL